jgi:hypothetical protein
MLPHTQLSGDLSSPSGGEAGSPSHDNHRAALDYQGGRSFFHSGGLFVFCSHHGLGSVPQLEGRTQRNSTHLSNGGLDVLDLLLSAIFLDP